MYVERYWKILDQLSLRAIKALPPGRIGRADEKAIRSYILLCEDELQMRKNGYVSNSTYYVWADGMRQQLAQPMFSQIWSQVKLEAGKSDSFPYEYLRQLLGKADSKAGDPLSMPPPMRWVRGLAGWRGV